MESKTRTWPLTIEAQLNYDKDNADHPITIKFFHKGIRMEGSTLLSHFVDDGDYHQLNRVESNRSFFLNTLFKTDSTYSLRDMLNETEMKALYSLHEPLLPTYTKEDTDEHWSDVLFTVSCHIFPFEAPYPPLDRGLTFHSKYSESTVTPLK